MDKKVLIQICELEKAAEKAGGFVADPSSLRRYPKRLLLYDNIL